MIKIVLDNEKQKVNDFFDEIEYPFYTHLKHLEDVLTLLIASSPNYSIITGSNYKQMGTAFRMIAPEKDSSGSILLSKKIKDLIDSIKKVRSNNLIDSTLLNILNRFLTFLKVEVNLKRIITCPADKLEDLNNDLKSRFDLKNSFLDKPLGYIFDYDNFRSIIQSLGNKLMIKVCPYCNIQPTEDIIDDAGIRIVGPAYDHFYDQATNRILALSFYNLIPSCTYCNSNLKGTIPFNSEFHLHPFIHDFGDKAKFKSVLSANGLHKYEIQIKTYCTKGSDDFKRLLGDEIDMEKGNINVFKLKERYKGYSDKAEIMAKFFDRNSHYYIKSNKGFFEKLKTNESEMFSTLFHTEFQIEKFNLYPFSRLNRDLYDEHMKIFKLEIEKKRCWLLSLWKRK
jgi:hypothetical protein